MKSELLQLGSVSFPANTGERVYMVPFRQADGLPASLSRWQPTIDTMLRGISTSGDIFLMIDQGRVEAGKTQRRPGVHIDGYWVGSAWGHSPKPTHRPRAGSWQTATFQEPEAIMLASDVAACAAYVGEFSGRVNDGGDCSHIDTSGLQRVLLAPRTAYLGNVTMLHESLPVERDCQRTLVRLNLPGVRLHAP